MPTVLWPNGTVDMAPTWTELLDRVRHSQVRPVGRVAFRYELANRALMWNGVEVNPLTSPRRLFAQLECAKMLKIINHDTPKGN